MRQLDSLTFFIYLCNKIALLMGNSKICTIGTSDDGDRIYCLYKEGSETMAKGFYDFNKHTFIITEFYTRKLTPGQTPESVIMDMKETLLLDFDWELNNEDKIIQHIEEGIIATKRSNRKRNRKKR